MRGLLTGIRARLMVIIVLTLVPVVVMFTWFAAREAGLAERRLEGDLRRLAVNNSRVMSGLLQRGHATLSTLALHPALLESRWAEVQSLVEAVDAEEPEYLNVGAIAPDGTVKASAMPFEPGLSAADRPYFRRAMRTGDFAIGDYQVSLIAKRPSFNVGYPVKQEGTTTAVAYLSFDIETLREELRTPRPPSGVVQVLIDSTGRVILREPSVPGVEGESFPQRDKALSLVKTGAFGTFRGVDGVERRYVFTEVFQQADSGLYLGVGYEPDIVLAENLASRNVVLAGLFALTLLSMALGWLTVTRWVYLPVSRLSHAAQSLAEGDLAARATVGESAGELGELGKRFDAMAAAVEQRVHDLREAREELAGLNTELEERVRRRTAELETANSELEAFSYSVSHDLRAPLRTIDGFSQALEEDYGDRLDEEAHDHLGRVRAAARKMAELIDAMLMLSRLTRSEMRITDVDVSAMAEAIVAELREHEQGRQVRSEIRPGLRAKGDPALLRILLTNLLDNAWKYTRRTGDALIEVGCVKGEGQAVFFVRDNGVGFDMAYAGKLFTAFQRLHKQDDYSGIGIGLTTAARVVHRHGGTIWAEAEPDRGATFYFTLP